MFWCVGPWEFKATSLLRILCELGGTVQCCHWELERKRKGVAVVVISQTCRHISKPRNAWNLPKFGMFYLLIGGQILISSKNQIFKIFQSFAFLV